MNTDKYGETCCRSLRLLKGSMTVNRLNQSLNSKIQIDLEVINIKSINKPLINQSSKSFFSNRVINKWNSLPQEVVDAKTINEFKNKFDSHYKDLIYSIDLNYYK